MLSYTLFNCKICYGQLCDGSSKKKFNDVLHVRICNVSEFYCTSYYSGQKTYQGHTKSCVKLCLSCFFFGDFAHCKVRKQLIEIQLYLRQERKWKCAAAP